MVTSSRHEMDLWHIHHRDHVVLGTTRICHLGRRIHTTQYWFQTASWDECSLLIERNRHARDACGGDESMNDRQIYFHTTLISIVIVKNTVSMNTTLHLCWTILIPSNRNDNRPVLLSLLTTHTILRDPSNSRITASIHHNAVRAEMVRRSCWTDQPGEMS